MRSQAEQAERLARQAMAGAEAGVARQAGSGEALGRRAVRAAASRSSCKQEGGYVDHPQRSRAAPPTWASPSATLRDWRGEEITKDDVKALTAEEAKDIYYAKYWNALRCDELADGRRPRGLRLRRQRRRRPGGQDAAALRRGRGRRGDRADHHRRRARLQGRRHHPQVRRAPARVSTAASRPSGTFGKGWLARVQEVENAALQMAVRSMMPGGKLALAG